MNWKEGLNTVRRKAAAVGGDTAQKTLTRHLPTIRHIIADQIAPLGSQAVQDDRKVSHVCKLAYAALPLALRLAVSEEVFVHWCLKYRDNLFARYVSPLSPDTTARENADQQ
jgi:hypothetical protein